MGLENSEGIHGLAAGSDYAINMVIDARKSSVMVVPRMTIDLTLLIPGIGGGSSFSLLLMIISLVFAALSRRLFCFAHSVIWSSSVLMVCRFVELTKR